jgi:hypothetical protein
MAADHKSRFVELLADGNRRNTAMDMGKEALAEIAAKS